MTVIDVGTPPIGFQGWEIYSVRFHGFADLPVARGFSKITPDFDFFGLKWGLQIFTRGTDSPFSDATIEVHLYLLSKVSVKVQYSLVVVDANDNGVVPIGQSICTFEPSASRWASFAQRSHLMNFLVRGALVIEIRMQLFESIDVPSVPSLQFVPINPFYASMHNMFMDEGSADVVFEIAGDQQGRKTRSSFSKTATRLFAHRLVLQKCAPDLATLCGSGKALTQVPITDVKPGIFRLMLLYIYGGTLPDKDYETYFKEILDAADAYGVTNLKLQAEAWYVKTNTIEVDTMMEHLLYADAKNCALLKEAVMDFIVENGVEILEKVSLKDVPGGPTLFADLLTAMSRGKKNNATGDQFSTMRVSALRQRLAEKGRAMDGSREIMISTLRNQEIREEE